MSDQDRSGSGDPGSLDRDLQIDALCVKYEAALRAGEAPLIADYLGSTAADIRPALAVELERVLLAHQTTHAVPDSQVGPFTLVSKIGEGGMGEVWSGRQETPIRREVAIKFIKAGMDSKAVLARFDQERQALALLDHPNIARVLDGGLTAERRPYFVMEVVKGPALLQYCDEARLSIPERLALFVTICHAVQHAHNKGIVHRDLKPSNILVTSVDGKPMIKVIDFGLAKAIGGAMPDASVLTQLGAVIGTLEYMAPEQAYNSVDVDTRADIYSLGVVLYELLTGLRPFDGQRLREASVDELLRMIREEEPPRPSRRLSSHPSAPALAPLRRTEAKSLTTLMRGDLDWIVMKCLEKDRSRRYETSNSLARDIDRYLANEPIEARPPNAGYRLRKFVRRNRGPVLAGSLLLLVLVGAVVGTTWGLIRAREAEAKAVSEGIEKERAQKEAEAKEAETASVLGYVDKHVFAAGRPKGRDGGLGKDVKLAEAVALAVSFVDSSFPEQPLTQARVRTMLGTTLLHLGDAKSAEQQFTVARKLFEDHRGPNDPNTLLSMNNLATSYRTLGRPKEALELYQAVADRRKAILGLDHADTLKSLHNLANSYSDLGQWQGALLLDKLVYARRLATLGPDDRDTLLSMASLASSHASVHEHEEALKLREEVLKRCRAKFGPEDAAAISAMINLANTYSRLDRHDEALTLREEAVALMRVNSGPNHPDTLMAISNLANSYISRKRWPEALRLHREVLDLRRAKLTSDHPDTFISMYNVANTLLEMGKGDEAIAHFDEIVRGAEGKPVNPRLVPAVLEKRIRFHSSRDDAAACRANAEQWDKLTNNSGEFLAHAAKLWSMTSQVQARAAGSDAARLARQDADKAIAWLTKAVAVGYKNQADLEKNRDFDALRNRDDFRKLLRGLASPK